MSSSHDPPRFSGSSELDQVRRAIAASRRDVPDDARMETLSARIAAQIGQLPPGPGHSGGSGGSGGAGGGGAASGGAGAGAATAMKVVGAAVIATGVAAGSLYAARQHVEGPRAAPSTTASAGSDAGAAIAAPRDDAAAAPSIPSAPVVSVESLPVAASGKSGTRAAPSATTGDVQAETDLLDRAQGALAADPSRALGLCDEHRQRFPRGTFAQEREVIAIDALLRLGRRSDAEARAAQFARSYPTSPDRRRIDSLLAR